MSAIFDFSSLVTVLLLFICTCTYVRAIRPAAFDGGLSQDDLANPQTLHKRRSGLRGVCWKASRIGERVSPYVPRASARRGPAASVRARARALARRNRASQVAFLVASMAFHILIF